MRIASYNVENLFSRPAVMNLESWASGRPILDDIATLNTLLASPAYTAPIAAGIAEILEKYGYGGGGFPGGRPFVVQQVRGKLFSERHGEVRIVAGGRADWGGWIELVRDELSGDQVTNTGRVIDAVSPDVACLIEVEDRISLDRFNRQILGDVFGKAFQYDLLVDGNDSRGIDIGILSRRPITSLCSHIHDADGQGRIFSRDCPEYEIELADGGRLWVLGNHLKSKGFGSPAANNARRRRQAERVKTLYERRRERFDYVAVVGDMNDTPTSAPLAPLLQDTDLRDLSAHPTYDDGGRPGTYDTGTAKNKIDYILLSPALFDRVTASGIERRGIFAPNTFPHFPEVTSDRDSASDHAALWVDVDV